MDGVRAPPRTSGGPTVSTTTARQGGGPAGPVGAGAAGPAGLGWPSGRGAAATPDHPTAGLRAEGTVSSSDCATSTGEGRDCAPQLGLLCQVYQRRRLQGRAVSVRVLYGGAGG